jgi:hypothetical protein
MSEKPVNAWDRWPDESVKAYTAFELFLNLGVDRSLPQVVQQCAKSGSLIKRWSSTWKWFERAATYDAYMRTIELEARKSAIKDAASEDQLEKLRNNLLDDVRSTRQLLSGFRIVIVREIARLSEKQKKSVGPDGVPTVELEIPSTLNSALRVLLAGQVSVSELEGMALGVDDVIGGFSRGSGFSDEE